MRALAVLSVVGLPAPQGSRAPTMTKAGPRHKESSVHHPAWRTAVSDAARAWIDAHDLAEPFDGVLSLVVTFYLPRPSAQTRAQRADRDMRSSPDATKLLRSTEDALVHAGLVVDDSRFAVVHAEKHYADPPTTPIGAVIQIVECTS